jgi:hypothetical protein
LAGAVYHSTGGEGEIEFSVARDETAAGETRVGCTLPPVTNVVKSEEQRWLVAMDG